MLLVNAFTTTNDVKASGAVINTAAQYVEIVGKASSIEGNQTVVWGNTNKHTVNGTTYDDAVEFNHDEAAGYSTSNYTWFFDQYNNLIGSFLIENQYNYAVLKNIAYVNEGLKGGYATGTLVYMDGSENVVTIDKIEGKATTYSYNSTVNSQYFGIIGDSFAVTTNPSVNAALDGFYGTDLTTTNPDYIDGHLFQVYTNAKGNVELTLVPTQVNTKVYNKATTVGGIRVDDATTFLVGTPNAKGVYSYKSYNGINEVPTFSKNDGVKVDYVLAANGIAKYVYIIGTPDAAETKDLVLVTSQGWNYTLADGIYEVNLYTAEGFVTVKTMKQDVMLKLTAKDAVNTLFYISYTDGLAVDAQEVTTTAMPVGTDGKTFAQRVDGKRTFANNVLYGEGTFSFYTKDATIVGDYTALTDGMDFTNTRVYVVYTTDAAGNRVASKVYAIDLDPSTNNSGNPTDPSQETGTVTYILNTYYGNNVVPNTKTVTLPVGEHTVTLTEMANVIGVSTQNLVAFGASSATFTVTKGSTQTVTLSAYYAG